MCPNCVTPWKCNGPHIALPDRIVVDQHGHYWRDYGDYWSMCPVSEENVSTDPVAVYKRLAKLPWKKLAYRYKRMYKMAFERHCDLTEAMRLAGVGIMALPLPNGNDRITIQVPGKEKRDALTAANKERGHIMVPVVDASCSCEDCVARTEEFYFLPGRCHNCGCRFTVKNRKGDKAALYIECPECEVSDYGWRDYAAMYGSN